MNLITLWFHNTDFFINTLYQKLCQINIIVMLQISMIYSYSAQFITKPSFSQKIIYLWNLRSGPNPRTFILLIIILLNLYMVLWPCLSTHILKEQINLLLIYCFHIISSHLQKKLHLIAQFLEIFYNKNPAIWLVEKILSHNLKKIPTQETYILLYF